MPTRGSQIRAALHAGKNSLNRTLDIQAHSTRVKVVLCLRPWPNLFPKYFALIASLEK